jgi:hypothetical protein
VTSAPAARSRGSLAFRSTRCSTQTPPVVLACGGLFAQAQITGVVDHDFFDRVVDKYTFRLPIPSTTQAIPGIGNQRNKRRHEARWPHPGLIASSWPSDLGSQAGTGRRTGIKVVLGRRQLTTKTPENNRRSEIVRDNYNIPVVTLRD